MAKSKRPKTARKLLDASALEQIRDWLRQSPRDFGLPTSRWTLSGPAVVWAAQGLTPEVVSTETIRDALHRLGLTWQHAKRWLDSLGPAYTRKKGRETG